MNKEWMVLGLLLLGSTLQSGDYSDTSFHDIDDPILNNMLESCRDINNYPSLSTSSSSATTLPDFPIASATTAQDHQESAYSFAASQQEIFPPSLTNQSTLAILQQAHKKPKTSSPSIASSSATPELKQNFECPYCTKPTVTEKTFGDNSLLTEHIKKDHKKERPYVCLYKGCDKKFNHNRSLTRHIKTHTGAKPFTCKQCDRKFSQNGNLKAHMKLHAGEKPFACTYNDNGKSCGKKFTTKRDCEVHKRVHTREKPYQCDYIDPATDQVCSKRFSRSTSLTIHTRTHTGEKPFACNICNKKFAMKHHLKRHTEGNNHE